MLNGRLVGVSAFRRVGRSYEYGLPFLIFYYIIPMLLGWTDHKAVSPPISMRRNSDLIFYLQASVKMPSQSQRTAREGRRTVSVNEGGRSITRSVCTVVEGARNAWGP